MKAAAAARACYGDVVSRCRSRCVGRAAFLEQNSVAVHAVDQQIRPAALQLQLVGPINGELDSEPVTVAGVPVQLDAVTDFPVAAVAPMIAHVARLMGGVAVGAASITGVVPTRSRINPARHRAAHNHGAAGGSVRRISEALEAIIRFDIVSGYDVCCQAPLTALPCDMSWGQTVPMAQESHCGWVGRHQRRPMFQAGLSSAPGRSG